MPRDRLCQQVRFWSVTEISADDNFTLASPMRPAAVVARCLGDWGLGVQISRSVLSQCQNWQIAADIRAFVAAVENTSLANGERLRAWKT